MKKFYTIPLLLLFVLVQSFFIKANASDYYWISSSGNWDDLNHWATTSGGATLHTQIPTALDDVHFDAGSGFIPGNNTVTINVATAFCHSMDWTGAANNPNFASTTSSNFLKIYGSLTYIASMNSVFNGYIYFEATTPANTITLAGKSISQTIFEGAGGGWTFQDAFTCTGVITFRNGSINTNNQTVNGLIFDSNNSNLRTLTLGTSTLNFNYGGNYSWQVNHSNLTFNAGSSTINLTGINPDFIAFGGTPNYYNLNFTNPLSSNVNFGIHTSAIFHDVSFSGSGGIYGTNTFNNLTLTAGNTYQFQTGGTQTILDHWNIQGTCVSYILLQSSSNGNFATVNKANGAVPGFNIHIRDIHTTGGATFNAYNSVDLGGNSGWIFSTLPPLSNPGAITGPASLCFGATGITYYIAPVPGAISYIWTVPPGATITSGQGDTLIVVNFGTTSGNVTVTAFSGCANSSLSILAVILNAGTLAASTGGPQVCVSGAVSAGGTYYRDPSCNLLARIIPSGASPVSGTINTCVIIDPTVQYHNSEAYVQRHYDIEPATNSGTSTATVTLYFKDQEFVDFNTFRISFPPLPTVAGGGNSDPNIANVFVTQYHGLPIPPHNLGNPAPGYYSGTGVHYAPSSVYYNSIDQYWELTLTVNGFSGFYIHTNPYHPLPITFIYFNGIKLGSNHLINWKLNCNAGTGVTHILERSTDAVNFSSIFNKIVDPAHCQDPFMFTDTDPQNGLNFYRLKMVEAGGKITYSNIISLQNQGNGFDLVNVSPNPVSGDHLKLNITSARAYAMEILIRDIQGRMMNRQRIQVNSGYNSIVLNVSRLAPGIYLVSSTPDGEKMKTLRFVKQ